MPLITSPGKQRQVDLLIYKTNHRAASSTQRNHVSENKKEREEEKKKTKVKNHFDETRK